MQAFEFQIPFPGEPAKVSHHDDNGKIEVSEDKLTQPVLDVPAGMPLTNRLDEMTREQAIWAIRNGDAWLAYLKSKGVSIFESGNQTDQVLDADKYEAISRTLDRVYIALKKSAHTQDEKAAAWLDTLKWADDQVPESYDSLRKHLLEEIKVYGRN